MTVPRVARRIVVGVTTVPADEQAGLTSVYRPREPRRRPADARSAAARRRRPGVVVRPGRRRSGRRRRQRTVRPPATSSSAATASTSRRGVRERSVRSPTSPTCSVPATTRRGFDASLHPVVRDAHRSRTALRIPRSGNVFEALVPAVLEQRVVGLDAKAAWRRLVLQHGTPAPGPAPRTPAGAADRRRPGARSRCGTGDERASRRRGRGPCCGPRRWRAGSRRAQTCPIEEARRRLLTVRGIGPWTVAEIASRALGDADAVSVGDYHLAHLVGWALTGTPHRRRGDAAPAGAVGGSPAARDPAHRAHADHPRAEVRAPRAARPTAALRTARRIVSIRRPQDRPSDEGSTTARPPPEDPCVSCS